MLAAMRALDTTLGHLEQEIIKKLSKKESSRLHRKTLPNERKTASHHPSEPQFQKRLFRKWR